MLDREIRALISQVSPDRLRADLHWLAADPLPFRKLNHTRPGADKCSLYEADDFLAGRLESLGWPVERDGTCVQAFRCDTTKPKSQQYSTPALDDPWYVAYNLSARRAGLSRPDETLVLLAHKDSQSWVDSPGAYDNGVGTVGLLEIARLLADAPTERNVWLLWCNEEHRPWTSVTAARQAAERDDVLAAIVNVDSIGGKSVADFEAGRKPNWTLYTCDEGRPFAELMAEVNDRFAIGLEQRSAQRPGVGDDDGSFINAGYRNAVVNIGSWPYAHDWYHDERDTADQVDYENVAMAVQATLAAVLTVDRS